MSQRTLAFRCDVPSTPETIPIDRILHVTELCENILRHLSFYDLIQAQLVCRNLNATIKGSSILQERLFLKPASSIHNTEWVTDYKNRLFIGDEARPYLEKIRMGSKNYNTVKPIVINPILSSGRDEHINNSRSRKIAVAVSINDHLDRPHHPHEYFELNSDMLRSPERYHSCRSMMLTQPPATRVEVEPTGQCRHRRKQDLYLLSAWCFDCTGYNVIENSNGVTLGHVIDEISRRRACGKDIKADKIRFPGEFVITKEIQDWVYRSAAEKSKINQIGDLNELRSTTRGQ